MHPTEGKSGHEYFKFADITQLTTPSGIDGLLHNVYRNLKASENLSFLNGRIEMIRIDSATLRD